MYDIASTKTSCFLSYSCIAAIDLNGRLGSVDFSHTFNPNILDLPVYAVSTFTDNWVLGLDKYSAGVEKLVNITATKKVGNVYDVKNFNLNYPIGMVQDTSRNLWILNDAVRDTDGSILKTAYLTEISESGKLLGTAR